MLAKVESVAHALIAAWSDRGLFRRPRRNQRTTEKGDCMVTNPNSGTNAHEIAPGIYRINTPIVIPGGLGAFKFNQYLIADDEPLLFHTGPRRMFPLASEAVGKVLPMDRLRYIAFPHFEADECGSLNDFLAAAPKAVPVCSRVAAPVSIDDVANRPARPLADGETLKLGRHEVRWYDTPHLPHA